MTPQQMGHWLENAAKSLNATLDEQMDTSVIEKVYGKVAADLANLTEVKVCNADGPAQAWERFGREDRIGDWRRAGMPDFTCAALFEETHGSPLENGVYCFLMRERIRTGSHQAMHALKSRVRGRLDELRVELSKLVGVDNGNGSAPA